MAPPLHLLAINTTRRCNLHCAHCYLDAGTRQDGAPHELTAREITDVLAEIATRGTETMVVLTGGEPLLRPDMEDIVAAGSRLGLAMVMGTNGTLLTSERVASLEQAGLLGVGISVDSLDPQYHDRFRGVPGSWERAMLGIEACRRGGLSFQIHFSITNDNAQELLPIIEFSRAVGARVLNVFFLICTGRGESMTDIPAERYEAVLQNLVAAQARYTDLIIRSRCAPHFKRVAHEIDPDARINRISGTEGDGCIAGTHYCRITPEGAVTACPYLSQEVGNVREKAFLEIWDGAEIFQRLRFPELQGKCGQCDYRLLCGGCRARPVALGDGLMDTDPLCVYVPREGAPLIEPLTDQENANVVWSNEAKHRLARVPGFVRRLVKKRAEAFVAEQGETIVRSEHLAVLMARRFGAKGG
uniref:Radical SAM additional 4Fe4S-binding SPASM domain-containing protein n=1 Tax=Candidatus Kentrum sp. LFY TaxID=2126342 RepID=A0A450UIS2_9GAMM|nr:MAG: radical SAM additional 4Fe4S-binding SPASM domain-containing protein [Candidatus Kentron sp. LFY]